jgi:hypothetical protein
MFLQPFGQEFLRNDPCLREAVHALADFTVNVSGWGCYVSQLIMRYDVVQHVCEFQLHIFVARHWRAEIEIFYVHREESGARC